MNEESREHLSPMEGQLQKARIDDPWFMLLWYDKSLSVCANETDENVTRLDFTALKLPIFLFADVVVPVACISANNLFLPVDFVTGWDVRLLFQ